MELQFLANAGYAFLIVGTIAVSFFVIFKPSGYFHLSHAAAIVLSPYVFLYLSNHSSIGVGASTLLALAAAAIFGAGIEALIYRPFRRTRDAGLSILVVSLGIYVIVQNAISVTFGDQIQLADPCQGCFRTIVSGFGITVSVAQIANSLVSSGILVFIGVIWYRTGFGRAARAISENRELSEIHGVNVNLIVLQAVMLGSVIAGAVGLLVSIEVGVKPTLGFTFLLYGIIAAVIGGGESLIGAILGALILSLLQSSTAYFIDTKWAEAVSYAALVVFLILNPKGVRSVIVGAERN